MLPSSSSRVAQLSSHFCRAASFSSTTARFKVPLASADAVVDPSVIRRLRQLIIERHTPSIEPHSQPASNAIPDIIKGLDRKDVSLVQKSWAELRRAGLIHDLTRDVVEQIGQLVSKSLASGKFGQMPFAEDVALVAAATHSTDALNACFLAHLRRGDHRAVLELYGKFEQLTDAGDSPKPADLVDSEEESTETLPGKVSAFLAVVAARAMEDAFHAALKDYLSARIKFRPPITEAFLRTISFDSSLQNKVSVFVQHLDLAKKVIRSQSLSDHIQSVSRDKPEFLSTNLEALYNQIIKAMSGPNAYIASDRKFVTSTKPVFMSELVWASFLAAFLRRNRSDLAVKLWKDMSHFRVKAGIMTWNTVLDMYAERRATKEIVQTWGNMKAQGIEPNAATYRVVIMALFAQKRVADALRWFRTFEKEVVPSSSLEQVLPVYNAVLHGLTANRNHSDTVISLFRRMEQVGPKPDLVCYNTMLGFYGRSGDFQALIATISQMENAGIPGDVYTFSTLLSALLKAGRTDAPKVVQGIMKKQGIQPTVAFYTAIIDAQMREQTIPHLQAAFALLDEMDEIPDTKPNDVTYTSILAGLYRGSWLSAGQLETQRNNILARMKRKKIRIRVHGYNILIKACLTSEEPSGLERALYLYRELKEHHIPTNDTWYILLAALIRRREWQVAAEVANEIRSSGVQPSNSVVRFFSPKRKIYQGRHLSNEHKPIGSIACRAIYRKTEAGRLKRAAEVGVCSLPTLAAPNADPHPNRTTPGIGRRPRNPNSIAA